MPKRTAGETTGGPADSIELQPFYYDIKHQIVRPKQVVVGTRYFWHKWAPRLGPTLTVLIVRLRMHCYFNQQTNERRDWCFPTQQTLAEEIGVSRWTVMRELKKPIARQFVRVQYRSRYDAARKQTIRISSLYHVAMDDPLVEEDRGMAAVLAAGQMLEQAARRNDTHCGITEPGREVAECPVMGVEAKYLLTSVKSAALATDGSTKQTGAAIAQVQAATGPTWSKLPPEEEPGTKTSIDDADAVARELMQEQISPRMAEKLAREYPAEAIREKLAWVRQLAEQHGSLRNVPGFLRKAIEDDYRAPLQATGTDDAAPLLQLRPPAANRLEAPAELPASAPPGLNVSGRTSNIDVWDLAKEALRAEMSAAAFRQWLQPSKILHYEVGCLRVIVPDSRVQRYLESRLLMSIQRALAAVCGGPTSFEVVAELD